MKGWKSDGRQVKGGKREGRQMKGGESEGRERQHEKESIRSPSIPGKQQYNSLVDYEFPPSSPIK